MIKVILEKLKADCNIDMIILYPNEKAEFDHKTKVLGEVSDMELTVVAYIIHDKKDMNNVVRRFPVQYWLCYIDCERLLALENECLKRDEG